MITIWQIYDPATKNWTRLGVPQPGDQTFGLGFLNDAGEPVSLVHRSGLAPIPYVFRNGQWQALLDSVPGSSMSIHCGATIWSFNNAGTPLACYGGRAGIFQDGQFVDVWSSVVNQQGWGPDPGGFIDLNAILLGIDDGGRIYGRQTYNGDLTYYVLEPVAEEVPEPGTLALVGVGLAGLWRWRRSNAQAA